MHSDSLINLFLNFYVYSFLDNKWYSENRSHKQSESMHQGLEWEVEFFASHESPQNLRHLGISRFIGEQSHHGPIVSRKKSVPRNKCLPLYSLFLDSCFLLIKPIFQLPPTIALSPEIFVFLSDALVRNPKGDETLRFAPRPKKPKF